MADAARKARALGRRQGGWLADGPSAIGMNGGAAGNAPGVGMRLTVSLRTPTLGRRNRLGERRSEDDELSAIDARAPLLVLEAFAGGCVGEKAVSFEHQARWRAKL